MDTFYFQNVIFFFQKCLIFIKKHHLFSKNTKLIQSSNIKNNPLLRSILNYRFSLYYNPNIFFIYRGVTNDLIQLKLVDLDWFYQFADYFGSCFDILEVLNRRSEVFVNIVSFCIEGVVFLIVFVFVYFNNKTLVWIEIRVVFCY